VIFAGVILSGFFLAFLVAPLFKVLGKAAPWVISLFPFSQLLFFLMLWTNRPHATGELVACTQWVPGAGVDLCFLIDGLSMVFMVLISGIGGCVFLYSKDYLHDDPHLDRFYSYLLVFMSAMLGLVAADNVISLYVFWELTSISSFLLIGFHPDTPEARRAALQALLVTNLGGLAMLAGLVILAEAGDSYYFSELIQRGDVIRAHPHYSAALLLLLTGAFTKSAQMPFHMWLPNAMVAPTPVSAYLHSAAMVKGGIYLVARISPIFGGTALWFGALTIVGGITFVIAAVLGLAQRDVKRMLAYSTISVLGMLMAVLGIGNEKAVQGAMVYLFAHALYKSTLFMTGGAIDHAAGTRDLTRLGGLGRMLPLVAGAGILAAFSKSGVPPTVGLIGKELIYEAGLHAHSAQKVIVAGALFGNMFLAAVAWAAGIRPFVGRLQSPEAPHALKPMMWFAPLVLGVLGVALGWAPEIVEKTFLHAAANTVSGHPVPMDLALWHGFNTAVLLSILTLAGGGLLFWVRHRWRRFAEARPWVGPDILYDRLLSVLKGIARLSTRLLQSGYLRQYMILVWAVSAGMVSWMLFDAAPLSWPAFAPVLPHLHEWVIGSVMMAAAVFAIATTQRLVSILALGVIGFGVTLFFVLYSAPDLAITQFLVETFSVILFVLVLYRLPELKDRSPVATRVRDALVALAVGAVMTLLVLGSPSVQYYPKISEYFAQVAVSAAHGHNIVNVILVDFRVMDTLGEITVLAVAAIGVYSLWRREDA